MNNVINFLLILTLVFLVHANSNIGMLLSRTITGKLTLVILIIYLSASHGISSGILMSLITIVLLNNFREALTDLDTGAPAFRTNTENNDAPPPEESEKIPISLIIPTKMNKTDLEDHFRVASVIATMNAKKEETASSPPPSDSVAGVSTKAQPTSELTAAPPPT